MDALDLESMFNGLISFPKLRRLSSSNRSIKIAGKIGGDLDKVSSVRRRFVSIVFTSFKQKIRDNN